MLTPPASASAAPYVNVFAVRDADKDNETYLDLAKLFQDPAVRMGTLVRPLEPDEASSPNVVKAVLAKSGDALYFSRALVPHVREPGTPVQRWGHIGLYGYRRDVLLSLAELAPTPLEEVEKLEQLRALEHGIPIRCAQVSWRTVAVDVPEDVAKVEAVLATL